MIPRKIHYCWFGPKALPSIVESCIESWKLKLDSYEIVLWNEENSPLQVPFVVQAYNAQKYAFVSDYVRFWALFRYGGIYFDTDMYVVKSFDNLLENKCFFGWETSESKSISCGVIGAEPGHPFILSILDYYKSLNFSKGLLSDFIVPRIVSICYEHYTLKEEIEILPYHYFYSFPYSEKENVKKFMNYCTDDSYAIHLWNISWGKTLHKFRDKIIYYSQRFYKKLLS